MRLVIVIALAATGTLGPLTPTEHAVLHRCEQYRWLVDYNRERFFPMLNTDTVLAVMAQESHCDPHMDDGISVGLMAVTPQPWTASREELLSRGPNVYYGMRLLSWNLMDEEHNPTQDIRIALGAYNCGWRSLEADRCYNFGGYAYADRVLHFWLPKVVRHYGGSS